MLSCVFLTQIVPYTFGNCLQTSLFDSVALTPPLSVRIGITSRLLLQMEMSEDSLTLQNVSVGKMPARAWA